MKETLTMTEIERQQFIEAIATNVVNKVSNRLDIFIAKQQEHCLAHCEKTKDHHAKLYGNGQPGIINQMEKLRVVASIAAFMAGATFVAVIGFLLSWMQSI